MRREKYGKNIIDFKVGASQTVLAWGPHPPYPSACRTTRSVHSPCLTEKNTSKIILITSMQAQHSVAWELFRPIPIFLFLQEPAINIAIKLSIRCILRREYSIILDTNLHGSIDRSKIWKKKRSNPKDRRQTLLRLFRKNMKNEGRPT